MNILETVLGFGKDFLQRTGESRRKYSREIYEPLYQNLSQALDQVALCERANAIDASFLRGLDQSGRINVVPERIQRPMRELYCDVVPCYEQAWRSVNESELQRLLEEWQRQFRFDRKATTIRAFPKWYRFLGTTPCQPALLKLENPDEIPLWNGIIADRQSLQACGSDPHTFLKQGWTQAGNAPAFRQLREARGAALRKISDLRTAVSKRLAH